MPFKCSVCGKRFLENTYIQIGKGKVACKKCSMLYFKNEIDSLIQSGDTK
jgi:DNA-directed RNA polymerase subunit RPC12/RpoP